MPVSRLAVINKTICTTGQHHPVTLPMLKKQDTRSTCTSIKEKNRPFFFLPLDIHAAQLELPVQGIAIAVNNKMIPRTEWERFMLHENDSLVIIKAACGG